MVQETAWKGRTGGGNIGQRGLLWFFRYVDVRVGYLILRFVVIFYMLFARERCLAIYRYFHQRRHYSRWKAWRKTYRNHYLFGQTVLDKFAIFSGNGKRYRVTITGNEYFKQALEDERGCIVASSHVGNFEVAGYLLNQSKKRMNGIVFGGEAEVVQRLRTQFLGSNQIRLIPVMADMSHIFSIYTALQEREIVSMPCDRVFTGNKVEEIEFLGAKATFPSGAYYLAERFQVDMLAFFVMKEPGLHYHLYIRPLKIDPALTRQEEKVRALTEAFVRELTDILEMYPEQWFNYYDFWKKNE